MTIQATHHGFHGMKLRLRGVALPVREGRLGWSRSGSPAGSRGLALPVKDGWCSTLEGSSPRPLRPAPAPLSRICKIIGWARFPYQARMRSQAS